MEKKPIPFVRKLCAHLSVEEILKAEERMRNYIYLALKILERKQVEINKPKREIEASGNSAKST